MTDILMLNVLIKKYTTVFAQKLSTLIVNKKRYAL